MQSLGETQIDLGAAIVPPPTSILEHSRESGSRSPLVGQEGDINDAVIDNIVEEDSEGNKVVFFLWCTTQCHVLSCCGLHVVYDLEEGELEEESQAGQSVPPTASEPLEVHLAIPTLTSATATAQQQQQQTQSSASGQATAAAAAEQAGVEKTLPQREEKAQQQASTSGGASEQGTSSGGAGEESEAATAGPVKRKLQPIVWEPSTSCEYT